PDKVQRPVIKLHHISKTYPNGLRALKDVNIEVGKGEIYALVGQNGAGKSTLMNILYGLTMPSGGTIEIRSRPVTISHPMQAIGLGIGMVQQDLMLVPSLTVMENIVLGTEGEFKRWDGAIDMVKMRATVQTLLDSLECSIDPLSIVGTLPIGSQQMVEIAKVFWRNASIIIFDEPTSLLSPIEAEQFLQFVLALKAKGKTVLFISHRLKEVFAIAERISVLRQGVIVASLAKEEANAEKVATLMVGERMEESSIPPSAPGAKVVLRVKDVPLAANASKTAEMEIHSGEIVGIAGVQGNGQEELFDMLLGKAIPRSGDILFFDRSILRMSVRARRDAGIAYITSDRIKDGLAVDRSVLENGIIGSGKAMGNVLIRQKEVHRLIAKMVRSYKIKGGENQKQKVRALSGGNMQKIVVAREVMRNPTLLVAFNPTSGVDIAAKKVIHDSLREIAGAGNSVLLISNDLEELLELSGRIIVLYKMCPAAEFKYPEYDMRQIGMYMTGVRSEGLGE
ncbi:MAG TPA: ATP-binding cassette domain-containing protein, partial [Rectinema sp.]|nr:ATP-binding cassette domain-containing protein [Rectinema sp.]